MKNKNILLLKTLLLSTSQINKYKYCRDKKKRGKIMGGLIGMGLLYLMLMAYCIATVIGYGEYGLIGSAPGMCASTISIIAFVFTFFKTNGYLFNFKEYDMLMSLPFKTRTVAACKFLYMYVKSLPFYLSIAVAVLVGYGIYAKPGIAVYIIWLVLSLFLPCIPMVIAAFIGFLIAKVSSGFKKKNLLQTVLTILFVLFCFFLRFFMEDMFREQKVEQTLQSMSSATDSAGNIYIPIKWFTNAVIDTSLSDILLLTGVSILLFAVVFIVVGGSYRSINSKLKSHAAAKNYKMTAQKKRSVISAIVYKEWKRMTGSTIYMTNGIMGMLLALLTAVIALIVGPTTIQELFEKKIPLGVAAVRPAIPFLAYFFVGMFSTPVSTPSLEGKNYWIVQSLPLSKKTLYQGKMLFNMYLTVPAMEFSIAAFCIVTKTPVVESILYLVLGFVLCAFSTAWGCVCGIKHMKLDWENEVEVIKQGTAVMIYMFPNMFIGMAVMALLVYLGTLMPHNLIMLIAIPIVTVLALLSYKKVLKLASSR